MLKRASAEEIVAAVAGVAAGRRVADPAVAETLASHVSNPKPRLGVTDRTKAVLTALRRGLVRL